MSVEVMELFGIFSKTFGKEDAQAAVRDIETLISDHKRELATKADLERVESSLKGDIRETELKLTKEIEITRGEIKEVELKLTKEIEAVKLEVEKVRSEIEKAKSSTIKWVVGWVAGLMIAYTGVIITVLTLLK